MATNNRKWKAHLMAAGLILVGYAMIGWKAVLAGSFPVYSFAILTAAGLYKGANVWNKKVLADHNLLPSIENNEESKE